MYRSVHVLKRSDNGNTLLIMDLSNYDIVHTNMSKYICHYLIDEQS